MYIHTLFPIPEYAQRNVGQKCFKIFQFKKTEKGFRLWQILKCFVGTFLRTHTVKLRGVHS